MVIPIEAINKLFYTLFLSMLPIVELRGAIPYAITQGLPPLLVLSVSICGNMLPVPFIIVFIRKLFSLLKERLPRLKSIIESVEKHAHLKSGIVLKYGFLGICLLVAIPLPGTGAWTGALVAAILDMRLRSAIPAIALGVLIAGIIVLLASIGIIKCF